MRAPSASSTSAEPTRPVAERLPCLATAQPAPAAISAAVVETLKVGRPPPVPAVSTRSSRSRAHRRGERAHRAAPGPRARPRSRPWCAARSGSRRSAPRDALPAMISASTAAASSGEVVARGQRVDGPGQDVVSCKEVLRAAACRRRSAPTRGGTGRPRPGSSRWRMPMTTPPPLAEHLEAVRAGRRRRRRASGSGPRSAAIGRPAKIVRPSCSIVVVLPCTGTWRTTLPPNACASDWWPRQTPSVGTPASGKRRMTSSEMPASVGVHGPGETTTRSEPRSSSSSTLARSLRTTSSSHPSSPRYWTRL